MAAMEQERYAFSRGEGYDTYGWYDTYGGCSVGFPTSVELQLQSATAAVLGAGGPGTARTRTRVVPVASPKGRRNSSATGIVSILLPCVSRADAGQSVSDAEKDVVVRNSTYHFSEDDDDEAVAEIRRPTPQHRLNVGTETFQTAGSSDLESSLLEIWTDPGRTCISSFNSLRLYSVPAGVTLNHWP